MKQSFGNLFVNFIVGFLFVHESLWSSLKVVQCQNLPTRDNVPYCFDTRSGKTCLTSLRTPKSHAPIRKSYKEASRRCKAGGPNSSLIAINSLQSKHAFDGFIMRQLLETEAIITDARMLSSRESQTWSWVNGQTYSPDVSNDVIRTAQPFHDAGCVDLRRGQSLTYCLGRGSSQMSYICEFSGFSSNDSRRYIGNEGFVTWYDARKDCLSSGGDLASVTDLHMMEDLPWLRENQKYWIGLHRNKWIWSTTGSALAYTDWENGFPAESSDKQCICVRMRCSREDGRSASLCEERNGRNWRTCNCHDSYAIVCQSNVSTSNETAPARRFTTRFNTSIRSNTTPTGSTTSTTPIPIEPEVPVTTDETIVSYHAIEVLHGRTESTEPMIEEPFKNVFEHQTTEIATPSTDASSTDEIVSAPRITTHIKTSIDITSTGTITSTTTSPREPDIPVTTDVTTISYHATEVLHIGTTTSIVRPTSPIEPDIPVIIDTTTISHHTTEDRTIATTEPTTPEPSSGLFEHLTTDIASPSAEETSDSLTTELVPAPRSTTPNEISIDTTPADFQFPDASKTDEIASASSSTTPIKTSFNATPIGATTSVASPTSTVTVEPDIPVTTDATTISHHTTEDLDRTTASTSLMTEEQSSGSEDITSPTGDVLFPEEIPDDFTIEIVPATRFTTTTNTSVITTPTESSTSMTTSAHETDVPVAKDATTISYQTTEDLDRTTASTSLMNEEQSSGSEDHTDNTESSPTEFLYPHDLTTDEIAPVPRSTTPTNTSISATPSGTTTSTKASPLEPETPMTPEATTIFYHTTEVHDGTIVSDLPVTEEQASGSFEDQTDDTESPSAEEKPDAYKIEEDFLFPEENPDAFTIEIVPVARSATIIKPSNYSFEHQKADISPLSPVPFDSFNRAGVLVALFLFVVVIVIIAVVFSVIRKRKHDRRHEESSAENTSQDEAAYS